jgi:hypothetical protein
LSGDFELFGEGFCNDGSGNDCASIRAYGHTLVSAHTDIALSGRFACYFGEDVVLLEEDGR